MTESTATAESVGAQGPYHPLRIARVIDETADARSFVLEVPDELRDAFAYRSGQFLTFRVTVDGERLVRCYSLASSLEVEGEHKVTVKRIDDGRVSNWMNENLQAGDTLETMRPAGVFCLQSERRAPLVLFGGGSGITPVISILKTALAHTERSVRLVYANRDEASIIFRAELEALVAKYPERLEVVHRLDVVDGFLDEAAVREAVGANTDADFYMCGPGPFMDVVEATLAAMDIPSEQVFIERFVSLSGDDAVVEIASEESDEAPSELIILLDGKEQAVPYTEGQTILQAVRGADLEPPFACEEGYCSCCMAKVLEGQVRMGTNDALDDEQVEAGWVLTCQALPTTARVKIEYPD